MPRWRRLALLAPVLAAVAYLAPAVQAQQSPVGGGLRPVVPGPLETALKGVRLDQKLDAQVPLHLRFRDETGKSVELREYFGQKPVMLMLIQYQCTMLCNEEMNVLIESMKRMSFTPGKEYNLLIVSIDPREQPEFANEKKKAYLQEYGRPTAAAGWHFLTGDGPSIQGLADAVGFHYVYDQRSDQYAHPDGVIILTPHGKIARYFFGLTYPAQDLRFGLVEAAGNKIGTPLDAIALLCFHYNAVTGRYALVMIRVVQLGAIVTVLGLAFGVWMMKRRERRGRRRVGDVALLGEG